jgi:pimeloyl-ACP methyl ester carboxylesterase
MKRAQLADASIEYDEAGAGEPVLLLHGGFVSSVFPDLAALSISERYRLISYRRRGYGGSSPAVPPRSMQDQAADSHALLRHLDISRAHIAGYSYGGGVAIQLALDAPDLVGSLALLEPSIPSAPVFVDDLEAIFAMYTSGDREAAVGAFLAQAIGPDYRELLDGALGPGAFDQVVIDSDAAFLVEAESLSTWKCDVTEIRQPVLAVVGTQTVPAALEIHGQLKQWLPQLEELVIPDTNHALPFAKTDVVVDGMGDFFDRHRL